MKDVHSCSYFCTRPACVLFQRNMLRDGLMQAEPVAWKGLTVEDMHEFKELGQYAGNVAIMVEATLRERNAPQQAEPTADFFKGLK